MKTLSRIVMILIAALVVAGAAYALSQTTPFSAVTGQPPGVGERPAPPDQASSTNGLPTGFSGEREGGPAGGPVGGGGSFETLGRNLLIMAALIAAVQVLWSIGRRLVHKKPLVASRYP
jgi:hypothetical protein